jgi:hypothetical protein
MYACVSACRYLNLCLFPDGYLFLVLLLPPIGTAILSSWISRATRPRSALPFISILVLAFTADGIFLSLRLLLNQCLRGKWSLTNPVRKKWIFGCLLSLILCWSIACALFGSAAWLQPQAVLSITSLIVVWMLALALVAKLPPSARPEAAFWYNRQVDFVVWMLLLLPFITVGDFVVIPEGLVSWTVPKVLIPVGIRLVLSLHVISWVSRPMRQSTLGTIVRFLRACVVTACCWKLLTIDLRDGASDDYSFHPLSALLLSASICDIVEIACMASRRIVTED